MNPYRAALLAGVLYLSSLTSNGHAGQLIELQVSGVTYQGLNIAHDDQFCWLAASNGSYERLALENVKSFRKVGGEFRPLTPGKMAGELRSSLGRKFEIETRGSFVVCAPAGQSHQYSELVTDVEKSFKGYFQRRGWPLLQNEFPLVLVVLPDRTAFRDCCLSTGLSPDANLRGFYHPQTNRVTLYDQAADSVSPSKPGKSRNPKFQMDEASRKVAVHETIHQLAFNSGLHQRIGENPRWVVEGLATLLEAGALESTNRTDTAERVNPERLRQFQEYRARRPAGSLITLISEDEKLYHSAPLDFYSESWAVTFYLSETRRPDYIRYLKKIAARDPMATRYDAAERIADFQSVFGKDLRWMETQFLRFIERLP